MWKYMKCDLTYLNTGGNILILSLTTKCIIMILLGLAILRFNNIIKDPGMENKFNLPFHSPILCTIFLLIGYPCCFKMAANSFRSYGQDNNNTQRLWKRKRLHLPTCKTENSFPRWSWQMLSVFSLFVMFPNLKHYYICYCTCSTCLGLSPGNILSI